MHRPSVCLLAALIVSGCSTSRPPALGAFEPSIASPSPGQESVRISANYRIGPSDVLNLSVYQVEDLSFEEIRVDSEGRLQMPLIGAVQAAGLTATELAAEIEARLGDRYLINPRVNIFVSEAASQKVTIDGAVVKPGVYKMQGRTTLLQAIAMAEGATRVADLRRVAVFRTVEEGSMVAVFDLRAIRSGEAADPALMGDDVVIVDTSVLSARMQDFIQALPALASFVFYARG